MLVLAAVLPVAAFAPVSALGAPDVALSPANNAGTVGSFFDVFVTIDNVDMLIGYDVTLTFNNAALAITSSDFISPATLFGGVSCNGGAPSCTTTLVAIASNALGEVRSARVLFATNGMANTVTVDGIPATLFSVSFKVIASLDSPLPLSNVQLACDVNNAAVPCPTPNVSGGNFFVPPSVGFTSPNVFINPNATVQHTHLTPAHTGNMPIFCTIMLDPNALRSGFGGCVVDVVNPKGVDVASSSNIAFMFPGQAVNVTAIFTYTSSAVLGPYTISGTVLQCVSADPSSCVLGSSIAGPHFKMNP